MKLFGNGNVGTGIALGIGAAFLLPMATKVIATVGKPLLKETIKSGMYVYETGRTYLAEARETVEDLSAEARSEMQHEEKPKPAAASKKTAGKK